MSRFKDGFENQELSKLSKFTWALIGSNVVSHNCYIIVITADFVYQLLILLQLFCQTHQLQTLSSYLRTIIELDNKDQHLLHYKTVTLGSFNLGLLAILMTSFIFSSKRSRQDGARFQFKLITFTLVALRSLMLTVTLLNLFAPLFTLGSHDQTFSTLMIMISAIAGLLCLLPITYLIAFLFNLAIPNKILPWSETSTRPYQIEVLFKLILTLAYSGQSMSTLCKDLMIGACALVLIYKIYYRLFRSLIFNNTIFLISLTTDTILLHLIIFLEISLFSTHYTLLVIALVMLPITVVTIVYFVSAKARERSAILTGDSNRRIIFTNLYIYQQLESSQARSNYVINKYSLLHSQHCKQYVKERQSQLMKSAKGKLKKNVRRPEEDSQFLTGFTTDVYAQKTAVNLLQETVEDMKQNEGQDSFIINTESLFPSTMKSQMKAKGGTKRAITFQSLELKDSFADVQQVEEKNNKHEKLKHKQNYELKKGVRLLKHLFRHHKPESKHQDNEWKLFRIYFTLNSLNNSYHAHFELLNLLKSQQSGDYTSKVVMGISALYIEDLIEQKMIANDNGTRIDLGNLIEMNQLQASFDSALENVADQVEDFWRVLSNGQCGYEIYKQGTDISESITEVSNIYKCIETKQKDKQECAIYMQMAAFYKFVVFKPQEQEFELLKSRQALLYKKHLLMNQDKEPVQEKCIIMAKIDTCRPMQIEFSNKLSASVTKYSTNQLIGMKINQLMPELFAENHQRFVDRFVQSGKVKALNIHRDLFIRQSTGYVVPVTTYLYLNFQKKTHLVMMFEINDKFINFGDDKEPCAFMLANQNNTITEISPICENLCFLTEPLLTLFQESVGRRAQLEDLFCCISEQERVEDAEFHDIQVKGKYGEYLKIMEEIDEIKPIQTVSKGRLLSGEIYLRQPSSELADIVYIMKIHSDWYGDLEVKTISIKFERNGTDRQKYPMFQSLGEDRVSMFICEFQNSDRSAEDLEYQVLSQSLSSLSSSNSQTNSYLTSFDQFQSDGGKNNRLPKTLRVMLLIVSIPFLIMVATSSISTILTYRNLDQAKDSLEMAFTALTRQDDMSKVRFFVRTLSMIANGFITNFSSDLMPDRTSYYINKLDDALNEFRVQQDYLDLHASEVSDDYKKTMITYYRSNGTFETENRSSSYSSNLFIAYGESILDQLYQFGPSIMISNHPQINPDTTSPSILPTSIDQQVLYIQTNGISYLYDNVRTFTDNYNAQKSQQINRNIQYAVSMTWICLGVTCLCAFFIIPLYGKIQERVYQLMKLFFLLSKDQREQMLRGILRFKEVLKLQQNIIQSNNHPKETEQDEQASHEKLAPHVKVSSKKQFVRPIGIKRQSILQTKDPYHKRRMSRKHEVDELDLSHNSFDDSQQKINEKIENEQKQAQAQNTVHNNIKEFRKQIQKKKIAQAILIILLTCLLSSYFIIVQVSSSKSFENMSHSFTVSQLLYKRLICAQDVIQAVRLTILLNKQTLVNYEKDELVPYYLTRCSNFETLYQENLVHNFPSYLEPQYGFFNSLEKGDFCDSFYGQPSSSKYVMNATVTRVTPVQCKQYNEGIAQTGFSNIIATIYKKTQQLYIIYQKAVQNGEYNATLRDELNHQFAPLIDTLYLIFDEPQFELIYRSKTTTQEYFDKQIRNFFLLFSIFLIVLVVIISYFIYRILTKLKKEILMSNKLLFIIDYQEVTETQKNSINQYLNKF